VIALYHQHGASEQFHSELKSDMDLERLPSGKFATNALMLSLGLVAYNVLRLCGQTALAENRTLPAEARMPVDKPVARRRLRSVIQDLIHFAARLTRHANRWGLSLWRSNPWRVRLYQSQGLFGQRCRVAAGGGFGAYTGVRGPGDRVLPASAGFTGGS
jgi:hypothetical protein